MMDPIVLYYGKGQLTGFLVDPNGVLDVVSNVHSHDPCLFGLGRQSSSCDQCKEENNDKMQKYKVF